MIAVLGVENVISGFDERLDRQVVSNATVFDDTYLDAVYETDESQVGTKHQEPLFYGEVGIVERVVHELAHAILLGLQPKIGGGVDKKISAALASIAQVGMDSRDIWDQSAGRYYEEQMEAAALAIEAHAFGVLGEDTITMKDLVTAGEVQGVAEEQVIAYYEEPWSSSYGSWIVEQLGSKDPEYLLPPDQHTLEISPGEGVIGYINGLQVSGTAMPLGEFSNRTCSSTIWWPKYKQGSVATAGKQTIVVHRRKV